MLSARRSATSARGSGGGRQLGEGQSGQGAADDGCAADHRRSRFPPPARSGSHRAAVGPGFRRKLLEHVFRCCSGVGDREGLRGLADPVRGALLQRLDVRRSCCDVHTFGHLQRSDRCYRHAQGPVARRCKRSCHARHARDRRPRPRRSLDVGEVGCQGEGHGLRAPRLQER